MVAVSTLVINVHKTTFISVSLLVRASVRAHVTSLLGLARPDRGGESLPQATEGEEEESEGQEEYFPALTELSAGPPPLQRTTPRGQGVH